jgi:serine/threonine-protein kinase RsbW
MRQGIRIAGTGEGSRLAIEAFDRFCTACGLGGQSVWKLQIALDEVLSNSIGHGCAGRPGAQVQVTFELLQSVLEVTVVDDGPAFDPLSLPAPDTAAPLENRQAGGLGVYLTTRLVERISYERRDGRNRLAFARRVAGEG